MNILWLDVETSGLDPNKHGIVQLAYIITQNGTEVCRKNLESYPEWATLDAKALAISNRTIETVKTYPPETELYKQFHQDILQFKDYNLRLAFGGYNVDFDKNFISKLFKNHNNENFGYYFSSIVLDPFKLIHIYSLVDNKILELKNFKLKTLSSYFNIPHEAHDALSDIMATRKIYAIITKKLLNNDYSN